MSLVACLCFLTAAASVSATSVLPADPSEILETDLASDSAWTLSIDEGAPRPIKVTAGGWNSDQQTPQIPTAAVKDHVVYTRQITLPSTAAGHATKILFGACNYGAEVYLDGRKIAEHHAPMTPFAADLTDIAEPGKTYTLSVKAFHRFHYGKRPTVPVGFDSNAGVVSTPYAGCTNFPYGLTGYVRLAVYPAVYISDVFVRPSVTHKTLACDVWISNRSRKARKVTLSTRLRPHSNDSCRRPWPYPNIADRTAEIAAGQTVKISIGDTPWNLGPETYWWPNIPFREDYVPMLHWLVFSLSEDGKPLHERRQRFGFVEHAEGKFYYTVNGVRYTSFSDSNSYGQVGEYDCWTETPCFQPPHGSVKGCPETWKRYQRIGFNSMRLSTSVPTEYMLASADEAGYLLIPEGGSWARGICTFNIERFGPQLQGMIRVCRNHPCVSRYSLANESITGDGGPWRELVDAALEADDTRPYVFEVNFGKGGPPILGIRGGHAYRMQHYDPIVRGGDFIRGMGECAWWEDRSGVGRMGDFAIQAVRMRLNDYAHMAPWSWVNYWPNFLEGMSHERHPWKFDNHADRTDGVDGWGSPLVRLVQHNLHPYLVQDHGILADNPGYPSDADNGKVAWPPRMPECPAGKPAQRTVEVFNGGLFGDTMLLVWTGHWDRPDGPLAIAGGQIGPFTIAPGFHASQQIRFTPPAPGKPSRRLYLVMESRKDDKPVFREEGFYVNVVEQSDESRAKNEETLPPR